MLNWYVKVPNRNPINLILTLNIILLIQYNSNYDYVTWNLAIISLG